MRLHYKNKGTVIVYTRGMTNQDAIKLLNKRISNREKEIQKRKWIVDQYNSLVAANELDKSWVISLSNNSVVLGGEDNA